MVKDLLYKMISSDSLIGKLLMTLIYIIVYDFIFENYIVFFFGYAGISYTTMSIISKILWATFSLAPMVVYKGSNNISSFLCLFIYIFVFIPFEHALFITWQLPSMISLSYGITLSIFFCLYFGIGHGLLIFKDLTIKQVIPFRTIEWVTIFLTLIFITMRASSMHMVSIFDIETLYSLREDNSEQDVGSLIPYIQGWLSGAFYPFLLVCYLKNRSKLKACGILLGYFLLFMVDMQKLTFVLPFVLMLFYILLQKKYQIIVNRIHSFMFISLAVTCIFFYMLKDDMVINAIGFAVLLRTVCIAGWLTQMYTTFFLQNPFTYYSHINIVNAITNSYPYNGPLGKAVAYDTQNANANFFLTDGIAAGGIGGLIFIGIFFFFFLHFINAISFKYRTTDLLVVFLPTLSYMLNVSIFTTLLTSGLLILLIILFVVDNPLAIKEIKSCKTSNFKKEI